jgi:hypothetical protein
MSDTSTQDVIVCCSDGKQAMQRGQIKALVEKGLVAKGPNGDWISALAGHEIAEKLEEFDLVVCDFCSGTPVTWDFPASSFVDPVPISPPTVSVQGWAACDLCAELIHNDQRDELADRSARSFADSYPGDVEDPKELAVIKRHLRALHEAFFAHREGAGKPYVPPGLGRS